MAVNTEIESFQSLNTGGILILGSIYKMSPFPDKKVNLEPERVSIFSNAIPY